MTDKIKDIALVLSLVLAAIAFTGWYYIAKVDRLEQQIRQTEQFLQGVQWQQAAVNYLNSIGYANITFNPPTNNQAASGDTTN